MKLLLVHSFYQSSGGEDVVFTTEKKMLQDHRHDVIEYTDHNKRIASMNIASAAVNSFWSANSQKKISELIRREKPDIAHFHNIFPLISPSAYYACKEAGVAVAQTVHNYRLICPAATLFRNGNFCEDCIGKTIAYPGIMHKCYHDSASQTAVVAGMNFSHKLLGTWHTKIDTFIVLSEFMKNKIVSFGLDVKKVAIKPNFVYPPDTPPKTSAGDYFFYAGRLAPEKGLSILLKAWSSSTLPLRIAGDGPMKDEVISFASKSGGRVQYLQHVSRDTIFDLMRNARALILPSTWHEPFGLTIIEAFASRLAVIASNHEPISSIITNGKTGLLYSTNDPRELALKAEWAWTHPVEMLAMGQAAYAEFQEKYTADVNYRMLMDIYNQTLLRNRGI